MVFVVRYEILWTATTALNAVHGKSLAEGKKDKRNAFSYCELTERLFTLKINKFKTIVYIFFF